MQTNVNKVLKINFKSKSVCGSYCKLYLVNFIKTLCTAVFLCTHATGTTFPCLLVP